MRNLTLAFFALMLAACSKPGPIPTPPPPPPAVVDAGSSGTASCESFCRHGKDLGCSWAAATPQGHTCIEVCTNVLKGGVIVWNLGCRTMAPSCAAVDKCEVPASASPKAKK